MPITTQPSTVNQLIYNNKKEADYQYALAPVLRAMAIEHLRKGKGKVARGFRGESANVLAVLDDSTSALLNRQAKNGEWGTYIELAALGELLNINIFVQDNNANRRANYALYESSTPNAPTITLENSNNAHWSYKGKAVGDGNCLYNAMALAIRDIKNDLSHSAIEHIDNFSVKNKETQDVEVKSFIGSDNKRNAAIETQSNSPMTTEVTPAQSAVIIQQQKSMLAAYRNATSPDTTYNQQKALKSNVEAGRKIEYYHQATGKTEKIDESRQVELDRQFALRLMMKP